MMIISSISGEQINHLATSAMVATVEALVAGGLLDPTVAASFTESHVCLSVDNGEHAYRRIIAKWFPDLAKNTGVCAVFRVVLGEK